MARVVIRVIPGERDTRAFGGVRLNCTQWGCYGRHVFGGWVGDTWIEMQTLAD